MAADAERIVGVDELLEESGSSKMEDDSSSVAAAAIVGRTAGPTNGEKEETEHGLLNMVVLMQ